MFILDFLISVAFGTLYGGVVMGIAFVAAIPYGIWQGMKWLWSRRPEEDSMATREQVEELKAKMTQERGQLLEAARSLSVEDSLRVPVDAEGEEQWTAREQLAHLWEMERNYDAWVRAALQEENPDLRAVSGIPVDIPIEVANRHDVSELVRALEIDRAYTLGLIDGIPLAGFDRTATSPIFGTLTVLQWLRSFYRHDRQHGAQILGRVSDYQPNFATGKEPNQRRMRLEQVARRQGGSA